MTSKNLLVPALAQQLPCDILYLIFKHSLPSVFNNTEILDVRTIPPFSFSLVCRSWRMVVETYPSLWSFLIVSYDSSVLPHIALPISPLIQHWLYRSASARLSLYIHFYCNVRTIEFDKIHALLTAQQHRWDAVSVLVDSNTPSCLETVVIPCPPSLSSLFVGFAGWLSTRQPETPVVIDFSCSDADSVSSSSRLYTLTTGKGVGWRLPFQSKPVHFRSTHTLDISTNLGESIGDTLAVLRECPCLSILLVSVQETALLSDGTDPGAESIVLLPELTSLNIRTQHLANSLYFLDQLSCPKLVSFSYASRSLTEPEGGDESIFNLEHINSFVQFFKRICAASGSNCLPLRTLQLFCNSNAAAFSGENCQHYLISIQRFFDMLGDLEDLSLEGVIVNDDLMKMMAITSGNKVLCPSLESLLISPHGQRELHWEAVQDMIVSRWSVVEDNRARRLRSLLLFDPKLKTPVEKSDKLRRCKKEGFELHLSRCKL